jgi:group I intron endonuclease
MALRCVLSAIFVGGYKYSGLVGFPCRVFQPPNKLGKSFMTTHHYVYRSYEEKGREYIGIRSCNCLPEEDIKYFGSFTDKTFNPTGKTILFACETREEVAEIEIELHDFFDVAVNPQFANQSKATSTGFNTKGVPRTEEWKKAHSERMSGENNPNYGVFWTEEQKKAMSERVSGENSPRFGVLHTEEWKKKKSVGMTGEKNPQYGRTGALHHSSKAIIAIKPNNTQLNFGSVAEASRELGIDENHLITRYLKTGKSPKKGKFKSWRFLYENP